MNDIGRGLLDVFTLGTDRLLDPLMNPGKGKLDVPPAPPPPTENNQQAALARVMRDEKQRRAFSNIYTSPAGALVPPENLAYKKLFGQ